MQSNQFYIVLLFFNYHALSIFDLSEMTSGRVRELDPKLMDLVADAVGVDKDNFRSQFEDVYPRAVAENIIISKSNNPNKSAWKSIIDKINATPSVAGLHPTNDLSLGLVLWFAFGISSSGVEQGFSRAQWGFGNRRLGAGADAEEYAVKVLLDIKNHDHAKLIELARKVWILCYGHCRASSTRITKGVGTHSKSSTAAADSGGFVAESEAAFIRMRRASAPSSSSSSVGGIPYESLMQEADLAKDVEVGWGATHTKELNFQKRKLRIRQVQGLREGVLKDDHDHELRRDMIASRNKQITDQRARVRKQARDEAVLAGVSGTDMLEKIRSLGVHVTSDVPASKHGALRVAFMSLHMYEAPMHAADVFVVTELGHAGKSVMATTALRGSYHVTPALLLTNGEDGVALKWHAVAQVARAIFVSAACRVRQDAGLQYIKTILDAIGRHKIQLVDGDWDQLLELKRKHVNQPSRVIALITVGDKRHPVTFVICCKS